MALEVIYAPQFADSLERILLFYEERNGNDIFSRKLLRKILSNIDVLKYLPEIGRMTDFPGVRILYVEGYAIEYQIRDAALLMVDIYSCRTNIGERIFKKC
jgi:plasmid stabilization system protein ParE